MKEWLFPVYTLENETIKITVSEHGAELHSITGKDEGTQYLWHGDEKYWKYCSPVLFPIVGKLVDSTYIVDQKTYQLPAHGFGRISEFQMINKTANSIAFELTYAEETLKSYPYRFSLQITYLLAENSVKVIWQVKNLDDKTIFFSIGAHPALMCPIDQKDCLEDCYLEFNQLENAAIAKITPECYLTHEKQTCLTNTKILPLSKDTFKNGVLIFDDLKSDTITIKSKNNAKTISVKAEGFPYWGIWAPETGAPFLCLEPWFGHADYADFIGEFKDKAGNQQLEIGGEFTCCYEIKIGQ